MTRTNRPKLGHISEGDQIVADGGFSCLNPGETLEVQRDVDGALFVRCADGSHYLDGQLNEADEYVGFHFASDE